MKAFKENLRAYTQSSIVRVWQSHPDREPTFKGYQTPQGVWCDENGVKLGRVDFLIKSSEKRLEKGRERLVRGREALAEGRKLL